MTLKTQAADIKELSASPTDVPSDHCHTNKAVKKRYSNMPAVKHLFSSTTLSAYG